jgi:hypothetical protein
MTASRCAVRLVVPAVMMAPFSWFLAADASAGGRDGRDAILQPPRPEIRPSPHILQHAIDRDADFEAAD